MASSPVLLLDGGFSNELSKRCSYDIDKDPLWTAKALLTDPNAVTETHYTYLDGIFFNDLFSLKVKLG